MVHRLHRHLENLLIERDAIKGQAPRTALWSLTASNILTHIELGRSPSQLHLTSTTHSDLSSVDPNWVAVTPPDARLRNDINLDIDGMPVNMASDEENDGDTDDEDGDTDDEDDVAAADIAVELEHGLQNTLAWEHEQLFRLGPIMPVSEDFHVLESDSTLSPRAQWRQANPLPVGLPPISLLLDVFSNERHVAPISPDPYSVWGIVASATVETMAPRVRH
jgi:hypothetical protein